MNMPLEWKLHLDGIPMTFYIDDEIKKLHCTEGKVIAFVKHPNWEGIIFVNHRGTKFITNGIKLNYLSNVKDFTDMQLVSAVEIDIPKLVEKWRKNQTGKLKF